MLIWNLTQHPATPGQMANGVTDLPPALQADVRRLLTFEELPTPDGVWERAAQIWGAVDHLFGESGAAMIGGAPFLMAPLQAVLLTHGIAPVYAFSKRESVDVPQPDGSVRKTAVFKHAGFVHVSTA